MAFSTGASVWQNKTFRDFHACDYIGEIVSAQVEIIDISSKES